VKKIPEKRELKVTAAICCFNAEAFIENAVRSLLRQSRAPDEIIVVDDGSKDSSPDVIKKLPVKTIKHNDNKGLAAARNTALKHARGDIIVYIDSDTIADEKMIEKMLSFYDSEEVYAVGGMGIEVNIRNIYDKWRKYNAHQSPGDELNEDAEMLPGLCCSYRKSALEEIGGFDEFFKRNAEDHDISIRLKKAGGRLVYSPDIKVEHYRTDSLLTLLKMIYRYDLWTIIARKRNKVDAKGSTRIPLFRIGVFIRRVLHILKGKPGVKFALIDFLVTFASVGAVLRSLGNHSKSS